MEQKVIIVSDADIKRISKRDFPQLEFGEIESILGMYKSESIAGRNRIYASILKLSDCNIELLRKYVTKAVNDYRDIIALSEYPNYSEYALESNLSDQIKQQLIDEDWMQYQEWFNKL